MRPVPADNRASKTIVAAGCLASYCVALFYDALFMRDPSWLQLEGMVGFNSRYSELLNLVLIAMTIGAFLVGCVGSLVSWSKAKRFLIGGVVLNLMLIPAFPVYLSSDVSSFATLLWAVSVGWLIAD